MISAETVHIISAPSRGPGMIGQVDIWRPQLALWPIIQDALRKACDFSCRIWWKLALNVIGSG